MTLFEADFIPVSYGFRPERRADDAIAEIHRSAPRVTAGCWTRISRRASTEFRIPAFWIGCGKRVKDKRVMGLVKAFLKAGIMY